jgi:hypothetical protein
MQLYDSVVRATIDNQMMETVYGPIPQGWSLLLNQQHMYHLRNGVES